MRLGLVLGAGAYPGHAWHVGVLRGVEDVVDVDVREAPLLVGTSVGAVTGMAVRGGFAARDLAADMLGTPMTEAGHDLAGTRLDPPFEIPPSVGPLKLPAGTSTGPIGPLRSLAGAFDDDRNLRSLALNTVAGLLPKGRGDLRPVGHTVDVLHARTWPQRETWITALRTHDGHREVFGMPGAPSTTPGRAAAASGSIPGVFRPVEIDGATYCDAGIGSTTHAELVGGRDDLDLVVVSAPLGCHRGVTRTPDAPVRTVVSAQVDHEVARLRSAGHRVVVLSPRTEAVRAMGSNWLDQDLSRQAPTVALARRHAREVLTAALA